MTPDHHDSTLPYHLFAGFALVLAWLRMHVGSSLQLNIPSRRPGPNSSVSRTQLTGRLPGDTIMVESGMYAETIRIDKKISLIGVDSGGGSPVIDAGKKGTALEFVADGCAVEGFTIRNSEPLPGSVSPRTITHPAQHADE